MEKERDFNVEPNEIEVKFLNITTVPTILIYI
jgi:hypothetical protein